jgi:hypothetical protein
MLEPRSLLADIAFGIRMILISTDFDEPAAIGFNFQSTISGAEDTGGLVGGHLSSMRVETFETQHALFRHYVQGQIRCSIYRVELVAVAELGDNRKRQP